MLLLSFSVIFFVVLFRFARQSFVSVFSYLILWRGVLHKNTPSIFYRFFLFCFVNLSKEHLSLLLGKTENLTDTNTLNGTILLCFVFFLFIRHTKSNEILDCLRYKDKEWPMESNGKLWFCWVTLLCMTF